jgi:hypothetical protein
LADDPSEEQTDEELERLRAENLALKSELDAARANSIGRRIAVGVLVAIGVIALAGGAAATWLRTGLRLGGIAIAILVIIAWPSLTVGIVVVTAIVLALYLVAIELFREGPSQLAPAAVGDAEGERDA